MITRGPSTPAITSGMRSSSRWPSRAIDQQRGVLDRADLAVHGARRDAQLAGDVAQRRLRQAVAGDALDGGVEHGVEARRRWHREPFRQQR